MDIGNLQSILCVSSVCLDVFFHASTSFWTVDQNSFLNIYGSIDISTNSCIYTKENFHLFLSMYGSFQCIW